MDADNSRFFAGEPPTASGFFAGKPPGGDSPVHRRRGIAYRLLLGVVFRLAAAVPVGLFAYVQYTWFLYDRQLRDHFEPYKVLGPLYFLANASPADDWIGYALLAVALPCLLAVVVWPRRWTALVASLAALTWVVPGCIDAPGGQ